MAKKKKRKKRKARTLATPAQKQSTPAPDEQAERDRRHKEFMSKKRR